MNALLQPLSRFLIAAIFIYSGITKIPAFEGMSAMMGQAGFPAPGLFLAVAVIIELVGGLMLLVGYRTRLASIMLILFMIPATLIFHVAAIDGTQQGYMEIITTLKNLAIIGALLHVTANGAGAYSVDTMKLREAKASPAL